jgi:3-hydroxyisobutyrate dehydrogenase
MVDTARKGRKMKIGMAGTGRMGNAIAGRLLALGYEVRVWNRTASKTRALAAKGATRAKTPAELAAGCDIVMTILTDAAAIEAVYVGPNGLLAGKVAGKLFVEMSTVNSEVERALAAVVRARGAAFVDCPVGGTVGPASQGQLFAFVGGEARDVARLKPVLEQLCRRIEHAGPVGSGATLKLTANLLTQVFWQSLGEALSVSATLDMDPARLMDIMRDMSGAPRVLQHRAGDIAATLGGKALIPVNFDIDSVRKDLRTIVAEAAAAGRRLPVTERALECFDEVAREGSGAKDCAMMPSIWLKRSAPRKKPAGRRKKT